MRSSSKKFSDFKEIGEIRHLIFVTVLGNSLSMEKSKKFGNSNPMTLKISEIFRNK